MCRIKFKETFRINVGLHDLSLESYFIKTLYFKKKKIFFTNFFPYLFLYEFFFLMYVKIGWLPLLRHYYCNISICNKKSHYPSLVAEAAVALGSALPARAWLWIFCWNCWRRATVGWRWGGGWCLKKEEFALFDSGYSTGWLSFFFGTYAGKIKSSK